MIAALLLGLSLGEGSAFSLEGPGLEVEFAPPRVADVCPSLESLGALGRRLEADLDAGSDLRKQAVRFLKNPEGPPTARVSTWLESLGTPLDRRLSVGFTIDLFGPEDVEGPAPLDARQAAPRIHYLSTGLGLRLKL